MRYIISILTACFTLSLIPAGMTYATEDIPAEDTTPIDLVPIDRGECWINDDPSQIIPTNEFVLYDSGDVSGATGTHSISGMPCGPLPNNNTEDLPIVCWDFEWVDSEGTVQESGCSSQPPFLPPPECSTGVFNEFGECQPVGSSYDPVLDEMETEILFTPSSQSPENINISLPVTGTSEVIGASILGLIFVLLGTVLLRIRKKTANIAAKEINDISLLEAFFKHVTEDRPLTDDREAAILNLFDQPTV